MSIKIALAIIGIVLFLPTGLMALALAINLCLKTRPELNRRMAIGVLVGMGLLAIYTLTYRPILFNALSCKPIAGEADPCVALTVTVRLNHAGRHTYQLDIAQPEIEASKTEVLRMLLPYSLANPQAEEIADKAMADYSGQVHFTIVDHFNPQLKAGSH